MAGKNSNLGQYTMIIDLTLPVYPGMPVYPGDPPIVFHRSAGHETEGYTVHSVSLGTHTGTHIDAPYHVDSTGRTVDDFSILSASTGEATVFHLTGVSADSEITPDSMGKHIEDIAAGDRILIATGFSERFGEEGYYHSFPSVSIQLARELADKQIALLGIDTPSLSASNDPEVHSILLKSGCVVVENLANLRLLKTRKVFFSAAPLALKGIDGSPVRAFAIIPD